MTDKDDYQPEPDTDSLEELSEVRSNPALVDETDDDVYELPSGEVVGDELNIKVIPQQADEFMCPKCFLVRHKSQKTSEGVCRDCE